MLVIFVQPFLLLLAHNKFSNLIINWGFETITSGEYMLKTVNFSASFNNIYCIIQTPKTNSEVPSNDRYMAITDFTLSTFNLYVWNRIPKFWLAIGS